MERSGALQIVLYGEGVRQVTSIRFEGEARIDDVEMTVEYLAVLRRDHDTPVVDMSS